MARDGNIRVGTAERERAIDELGEHFSEGRIDVAEYELRCGAAAAARTQAELAALFADLPVRESARPPAPAPKDPLIEKSGSKDKTIITVFAIVAALATVVVVAITQFWLALIPALIIGLVIFMMS
ncbi:DUF1707 SHOCT-like domain-containing protein [Actinokineospora sp.]|uniref:DUF1707 SHOCT-like domain-containing protein n=1 Tax=Actinokineospora sp. TaxID=1872133 RepID=UPI003D6B7F0C